MDLIERDIFSIICENNGIKAKKIGELLKKERSVINHYLYGSPYMKELCYQDDKFDWHGLIRQRVPHTGLVDFSGYYGLVEEFRCTSYEEWLRQLKQGCVNIGRNLNDTRGLFHSFADTYYVIAALFDDLDEIDTSKWEIVFELRIKRARYIRIYADVLVIANGYVFSLEFKMKDKIEIEEVKQAAKYCEYLEVLFGKSYNIIPALVLTKAEDLYEYVQLPDSTAEIPVCSGDMLFNLFDEYIGFLEK